MALLSLGESKWRMVRRALKKKSFRFTDCRNQTRQDRDQFDGLLVANKVAVGAVLVVGLANADKGFAKTVLVNVAHVTPVPGGFLVGGTFAPPLTYQELTTLVL